MKKFALTAVVLVSFFAASAQSPKKPVTLSKAGDHIMIQLGSELWNNLPDSIDSHKKGLARDANVYVMLNKPFKGNPKMSVALGVGVSTSNVYFKKMAVDIKSTASKLPFTRLDSADHFKKYKLTSAYLELPVELRFTADPENNRKSLKFAIGAKVGTLLSVHTKGKTLQDKSDKTIGAYAAKENSKRFFNGTRLSLTARAGYGIFSVFGAYSINSILKDGVGPDIKPIQVGITISGL